MYSSPFALFALAIFLFQLSGLLTLFCDLFGVSLPALPFVLWPFPARLITTDTAVWTDVLLGPGSLVDVTLTEVPLPSYLDVIITKVVQSNLTHLLEIIL